MLAAAALMQSQTAAFLAMLLHILHSSSSSRAQASAGRHACVCLQGRQAAAGHSGGARADRRRPSGQLGPHLRLLRHSSAASMASKELWLLGCGLAFVAAGGGSTTLQACLRLPGSSTATTGLIFRRLAGRAGPPGGEKRAGASPTCRGRRLRPVQSLPVAPAALPSSVQRLLQAMRLVRGRASHTQHAQLAARSPLRAPATLIVTQADTLVPPLPPGSRPPARQPWRNESRERRAPRALPPPAFSVMPAIALQQSLVQSGAQCRHGKPTPGGSRAPRWGSGLGSLWKPTQALAPCPPSARHAPANQPDEPPPHCKRLQAGRRRAAAVAARAAAAAAHAGAAAAGRCAGAVQPARRQGAWVRLGA